MRQDMVRWPEAPVVRLRLARAAETAPETAPEAREPRRERALPVEARDERHRAQSDELRVDFETPGQTERARLEIAEGTQRRETRKAAQGEAPRRAEAAPTPPVADDRHPSPKRRGAGNDAEAASPPYPPLRNGEGGFGNGGEGPVRYSAAESSGERRKRIGWRR